MLTPNEAAEVLEKEPVYFGMVQAGLELIDVINDSVEDAAVREAPPGDDIAAADALREEADELADSSDPTDRLRETVLRDKADALHDRDDPVALLEREYREHVLNILFELTTLWSKAWARSTKGSTLLQALAPKEEACAVFMEMPGIIAREADWTLATIEPESALSRRAVLTLFGTKCAESVVYHAQQDEERPDEHYVEAVAKIMCDTFLARLSAALTKRYADRYAF